MFQCSCIDVAINDPKICLCVCMCVSIKVSKSLMLTAVIRSDTHKVFACQKHLHLYVTTLKNTLLYHMCAAKLRDSFSPSVSGEELVKKYDINTNNSSVNTCEK